ncbi:4'-phosphopantetheinyl transferase family protein [Actinomadura sp. 1N219]|uniref:4'-phosphopantetheinyl transferase family protein n=1 Tax=Actinomadura sp. 1N219 TaxID=3375152 RepID=UPI0037BD09AD
MPDKPVPDKDAAGTGVDVWTFALDAPPSVTADLSRMLSADETMRAARLRKPAERRHFTVSRGAVRRILAGYLGARPEALYFERDGNGKPRIPGGIHFNLSHSAGVGVLAVTRGREVGIDVDAPRAGLSPVRLAGRYFPPGEARLVASARCPGETFVRLWTRKEAVVKAAGGRMVEGLGIPVADAARPVRDPAGRVPGEWTVSDLTLRGGHLAAVAVEGVRRFPIIVRHAYLGSA